MAVWWLCDGCVHDCRKPGHWFLGYRCSLILNFFCIQNTWRFPDIEFVCQVSAACYSRKIIASGDQKPYNWILIVSSDQLHGLGQVNYPSCAICKRVWWHQRKLNGVPCVDGKPQAWSSRACAESPWSPEEDGTFWAALSSLEWTIRTGFQLCYNGSCVAHGKT